MIEIKYPDGPSGHYHENGDRIVMNKTWGYFGEARPEYFRGDKGTIVQEEQVTGHPTEAYFTVLLDGKCDTMRIACYDMYSLEEPRLSFDSDEAESMDMAYDENGNIEIRKAKGNQA